MGWNGDYESEAYGVDSSSSSTSTSTSTDNGNGNDNRQAYTDRFGGTSTRNFNVNTSQPSVTKDGTTTYGTRAQLDDLFGPSQVDTTVPGTGFSFGGGRTTMAQMAGYAGKMSPTTVGGYGISAGRGSIGIGRQIEAYNQFVGTPDPTLGWTGGTAGVGTGLSKPTVVDIDMATGRIRSVTPGTVGLMEGQYVTDRTEMTTEQVSTMAAAIGYDYAGQMVDPALAGVTVGGPLGVDPSKAGYVGYGTDTGMNFARVTGEEKVAEGFIGGMGLAGAALVGLDPEFAEVTELGTGRVGTYTDVGGIAGLLGKGTYVSFPDGSTPPDTGGGDGVDPLLYRSRVPTPTPRFRSRQQFSPIRSMRFPSAPRPSYGRGPTAYAAEGGYIQGTDYLQKGLDNKLPGFHAMQFGGKVYAVSPDEKDPTQFRAYGGTMLEVRAAFGGAFGYDPSTIDFTKKPGEPGFGTDLKGFVPGVGGLNSQNQFVTANGTLAQNSADPFLEKYRVQMKIGGLAGFVGARPEQLDPQQTVEDSVPVDVPEGTFVLNGPATEYAGSKDVEEMLNKATQYAQEAGIDIEKENARIASKGLVKLAVSPGEVLIDPVRASIIGLDTLNKMNNRGKKEVARRQQEAPVPEKPPILAKQGGLISMREGGRGRSRREKQSQEDKDLEVLGEIAEDIFGTYKRAAERPDLEDLEKSPVIQRILEKLRAQRVEDNKVLSTTPVDWGGTQKQREISASTMGVLTPENAQSLYMEMPTLYSILQKESQQTGKEDPQAFEALRRMEEQLKEQIGGTLPQQNPVREINDTPISESFLALYEEIKNKPKQRTVSETPVGGEQGFISKSY